MRTFLRFLRNHKIEILVGVILAIPLAFIADWTKDYVKGVHKQRLLREDLNAVVVVSAYDNLGAMMSQGSGFLIKPSGTAVTCLHVIAGAFDAKVKVGTKLLDTEGVLYIDQENDVAVLKVKGGRDLPVLRTADASQKDVGKTVYVISNPLGFEKSFTEGVLSAIPLMGKKKALAITAPISPGSSGGPVFNEKGRVIGMVQASARQGQNLNFALPARVIEEELGRAKKVIPLRESGVASITRTAGYWMNIGFDDLDAGWLPQAADAFSNAIRFKPDLEDAFFQLGYTYAMMNRPKDAIVALNEAVKLKSDDKDAYYQMGMSYLALRDFRSAVKAFQNALGDKPDGSDAQFELALAHAQACQYREAIEVFKQVVAARPQHYVARFNLGLAYERLGMDKEAEEAFKGATEIRADYWPALFHLGLFYVKENKLAEAVDMFRHVTEYEPTNAETYYRLGLTYEKLNREKEAIGAFELAVRYRPDHQDTHYELALAYASAGDTAAAMAEYERLKSMNAALARKLLVQMPKRKKGG